MYTVLCNTMFKLLLCCNLLSIITIGYTDAICDLVIRSRRCREGYREPLIDYELFADRFLKYCCDERIARNNNNAINEFIQRENSRFLRSCPRTECSADVNSDLCPALDSRLKEVRPRRENCILPNGEIGVIRTCCTENVPIQEFMDVICKYTYWNTENRICPHDNIEAYAEYLNGQVRRRCCDYGGNLTNSEYSTLKDFYRRMTVQVCESTPCLRVSQETENLCTSLPARYIDGVRLEFEESSRTPCGGDGSQEDAEDEEDEREDGAGVNSNRAMSAECCPRF